MTDEERMEAERLAKLKYPGMQEEAVKSQWNFCEGYSAACEAKSAKINYYASMGKELWVSSKIGLAQYKIIEAERARSKKLAGFLKSLMLLQAPQAMQTEFWVEVSHELEANRE